MMNNGAFGQYQRGNSCSQGRGQASGTQPRTTTSCNQSQSRPGMSCNHPQPRPAAPCSQPQSRPGMSCNQSQSRPAASCNQPQPCPPQSCVQPQPRTSNSCSQAQSCPPSSCNQPQSRPQLKPVRPSCPCSEMNREQLLHWISLTKFACVDSNLYLDTHPCDMEAIAYFKEHVKLYNEALAEYSKTYGPLTIAHAHHCDTYWEWVNQPWPWQ